MKNHVIIFQTFTFQVRIKIIEVKSSWTYKCKLDYINEKAEATRQAGYEYEIWIYDNNGKTKQIV